jgi:hypothetical protein
MVIGRMGRIGIKVSNYGENWDSFLFPAYGNNSNDFSFRVSLNGIATNYTSNYKLLITNDGGKTWQADDFIPIRAKVIQYVLPTDEESGFYIACGNGCYKSYGNNSWIKLDNYSHSYVCFLDAEHGLSFSTNSSANDAIRVYNSNWREWSKNEFIIYPNPANQTINLQLPQDILYSRMIISTIDGKQVLDEPISNNTQNIINIGALLSGIYIATVIDYHGNTTHAKFVVQKY